MLRFYLCSMNIDASTIIALCSSGGLLYFVVEKLLNWRKDKADVQTTVISNGNEIAELYKKIDEIVDAKTAPIIRELEDIKSHWCCYREACHERILYKQDNGTTR